MSAVLKSNGHEDIQGTYVFSKATVICKATDLPLF
jgi:hypothetical protein